MKLTGLICVLLQLDTILPIQLSYSYPYQLPPSNLIYSYLSDWQAQHEALRKQWNEQEREIDKLKQKGETKSDAKPKLKLSNPVALRLEQPQSPSRVQSAGKIQTNQQPAPAQNVVKSTGQSSELGEQLEKLKQSPIYTEKSDRTLFQNSNGCACLTNDYACNNECIQQRMLQQASSVIGCMTACAAQSIGAIQNCMLGCSNVYYAQVTAPVPTPVTETPSPSSSTNPQSSSSEAPKTTSETPSTTSSSSETPSTTSDTSSTTTESTSITTTSESTTETPTPTSSQTEVSASPTPTNSSNPNINGTIDGKDDDDDDDDSAIIQGTKHTLIAVVITTLLTIFVI